MSAIEPEIIDEQEQRLEQTRRRIIEKLERLAVGLPATDTPTQTAGLTIEDLNRSIRKLNTVRYAKSQWMPKLGDAGESVVIHFIQEDIYLVNSDIAPEFVATVEGAGLIAEEIDYQALWKVQRERLLADSRAIASEVRQ